MSELTNLSPAAETTKQQRDRFLAFAFSTSDLLVEVDKKGVVTYALGAAKNFTGGQANELNGQDWLELFDEADRPLALFFKKQSEIGRRSGPIMIRLNEDLTHMKSAVMCGLYMPEKPEVFYLTLSKANALSAKMAHLQRDSKQDNLYSGEEYTNLALEALTLSQEAGQDAELTFIELENYDDCIEQIGPEDWHKFKSKLAVFLQSRSVDGITAGEMAPGKFSLVKDRSFKEEALKEEVKNISRKTLGNKHAKALEFSTKSVDSDFGRLTEREAYKAISHTIKEFEKQGNDLTIDSLNEGFEGFLKENASKISDLKAKINQQRFEMHFQPIVNIKTNEVKYYESLIRFEGQDSPYETVVFAEDVDMSCELDMAVCSKMINYMLYYAQDPKVHFSINISGASVENKKFLSDLRYKFEPHKNRGFHKRVIFELTESNEIKNLEKTNEFIKELQADGFRIYLDDFGAGAASFQYLNKLHVDGLKIDGMYTTDIIKKPRNATMLKNMAKLCKDLEIDIVAERVETKEQARFLTDLGIDKAQGYYYSKPLPKPEYDPLAK